MIRRKWRKDSRKDQEQIEKRLQQRLGDNREIIIAKLGENIQIRRFERFVLGEGLEKRKENFSDEVYKRRACYIIRLK